MMGHGCEMVTRVQTSRADVVTGRWKDGRTGTVRGIRDGERAYGAVVFGSKSVAASVPLKASGYRGLVAEVMKFFKTGVPPDSPEETLELMAFMEAADRSKAQGGAPVALGELLSFKSDK